MNSEFDKFESYIQKTDGQLLQQVQIACEESMTIIRQKYGPFDPDEIRFFKRRLADNNGEIKLNSIQKMIIFDLFYKYFQDTQTIKNINMDDYMVLLLSARRILEESGMYLLAAIVSSKVNRLALRKSVSKKELIKITNGERYNKIRLKYRNDKVIKEILSIIATILSSDFEYIDYQNDDIDGKEIIVTSDIVSEEVLMYVDMI